MGYNKRSSKIAFILQEVAVSGELTPVKLEGELVNAMPVRMANCENQKEPFFSSASQEKKERWRLEFIISGLSIPINTHSFVLFNEKKEEK
ncbi:Vacuolar Protein Sorting-Associated Protein 13C [Manis pentadactyla]|nr:Vacuolar Protein Sorting-Associated Protein 13C [Manis pentadactyla]